MENVGLQKIIVPTQPESNLSENNQKMYFYQAILACHYMSHRISHKVKLLFFLTTVNIKLHQIGLFKPYNNNIYSQIPGKYFRNLLQNSTHEFLRTYIFLNYANFTCTTNFCFIVLIFKTFKSFSGFA